MDEQFALITVLHSDHIHQLQEDTWVRSATNLLEEWTTEDTQIEDTLQDADLLQEGVIDMILMMIETVTTVEEIDMMIETDMEETPTEGSTETTIEGSKISRVCNTTCIWCYSYFIIQQWIRVSYVIFRVLLISAEKSLQEAQ